MRVGMSILECGFVRVGMSILECGFVRVGMSILECGFVRVGMSVLECGFQSCSRANACLEQPKMTIFLFCFFVFV